MRPVCLKLLDDGEQVADRARQATEPDHDEGLTGPDILQEPGQHRPAAIGAGSVLLEDRAAAGCPQLVEQWIGALFFG
jgi:hypothetical protein